MTKLSAMVHLQKTTDQDLQRFILHHPYMGMMLSYVMIPIMILMTVSVLCYAIMIPISFFMGWL